MDHDMNKSVQLYVTAIVWRLPNMKGAGELGKAWDWVIKQEETPVRARLTHQPAEQPSTDRERRPKRIPCTYFCKSVTQKTLAPELHGRIHLSCSGNLDLLRMCREY